MPIEYGFDVRAMSKNRFHEIDYQVMRHGFDIQNEFGRLYDESIYHSELVSRCENDGFSVVCEGEISVRHADFIKSYFIDALVDSGAIYEFKAVDALSGHHDLQLLNYMFLLGLSEGKLVNFAPPSVQHRFISSTVNASDRYSYDLSDGCWDKQCASAELVREIIHDLLSDWGAYLDVGLYKEALFHFLGGEQRLLNTVDVSKEGRLIGHQKFQLLDGDSLLHISSTIHNIQMYRKQLDQLFGHTNLRKIHWVNFCRQKIMLTTLKK